MLPGFDERRKALEYAFFREKEQKLLDQLRSEAQKRETRELLRERSGIDDDAVLDKLIELSINTESIVAMALVPLVRVAWADGSLHDKERSAILDAAAASGILAGTTAHALLDSWLQTAPDAQLRDAWKAYIGGLCEQLEDGQRIALRDAVVSRARSVAEAAGGFLGLASIAPAEEAELTEISKAFG